MVGTMTLTDEISGRMTGSALFPFTWENWPGMVDRSRAYDDRVVSISRIVFNIPVEKERSTYQTTEVFSSQWKTVFTPRTDLGKRLYTLRAKAVDAGMKLLSEEEVLEEVKRRRGEFEEDEKYLY